MRELQVMTVELMPWQHERSTSSFLLSVSPALDIPIVHPRYVDLCDCDLIPEPVEILTNVEQTLFCCCEFAREQGMRGGQRIRQHGIRLSKSQAETRRQ